jgi:hypothetical protein
MSLSAMRLPEMPERIDRGAESLLFVLSYEMTVMWGLRQIANRSFPTVACRATHSSVL